MDLASFLCVNAQEKHEGQCAELHTRQRMDEGPDVINCPYRGLCLCNWEQVAVLRHFPHSHIPELTLSLPLTLPAQTCCHSRWHRIFMRSQVFFCRWISKWKLENVVQVKYSIALSLHFWKGIVHWSKVSTDLPKDMFSCCPIRATWTTATMPKTLIIRLTIPTTKCKFFRTANIVPKKFK